MNKKSLIALAFGLGAGVMYWMDPSAGRRRRMQFVAKVAHWRHLGVHEVDMAARDAGHRLYGRALAVTARLQHEDVNDGVLAQRVRSRIGRVVSHAAAIDVVADNGSVTLSGPVLGSEVAHLVKAVRRVRGVKQVLSNLQVHESPGSVPGLQEGSSGAEESVTHISCLEWSGIGRIAAVALGFGFLGGRSRAANPVARTGSLMLGLGLITRGFANRPIGRLLGVRIGRRAVIVDKSIVVNQPVEQVFNCFQDFTNFPRFMSHVRSVVADDDSRFHWVVDGPLGIPVSWDADVIKVVPDELIVWRSLPGSLIKSAGKAQFTRLAEGVTRIEIQMSYNPIMGLLGHAVAKVLNADPKRQLDDDLVRMKSYLETGKTPRDAARRTAPIFGRQSHLVH